MNKILKRTGGVVIMIVAALVLLASVGGVVGLWSINGQVHDTANALFAPLDSGLTTATNVLTKTTTRLDNARTRISNAQEFVGQLGQNSLGNGAVLGAISDTIATKFGTEVDSANESVNDVIELVSGANNAIVALNRLPGVNLPTITDRLQTVQTRITALRDRIQQLRTDIEAIIQGRLQATGDRLNAGLEDLDSGLQNMQSSVDDYMQNVQQTQARVATAKSNISTAITVSWVIATIFLLWMAVSQVAMLLYGWSLWKSKPAEIAAPDAPIAGGDLSTQPAS